MFLLIKCPGVSADLGQPWLWGGLWEQGGRLSVCKHIPALLVCLGACVGMMIPCVFPMVSERGFRRRNLVSRTQPSE